MSKRRHRDVGRGVKTQPAPLPAPVVAPVPAIEPVYVVTHSLIWVGDGGRAEQFMCGDTVPAMHEGLAAMLSAKAVRNALAELN